MKRLTVLIIILIALIVGIVSFSEAQTRIFAVQNATGVTASLDLRAFLPNNHSFVVVPTGSPAGCTAQPQYSLDNVNWFSLGSALTCTSAIAGVVLNTPASFVRINLTALSGGSSPTVTTWYIGK